MNANEIITAANEAGFEAIVNDDVIEVTVTGLDAITWRYELIEAGAEYLGTVRGNAAPMFGPISSMVRTLRFRAC